MRFVKPTEALYVPILCMSTTVYHCLLPFTMIRNNSIGMSTIKSYSRIVLSDKKASN